MGLGKFSSACNAEGRNYFGSEILGLTPNAKGLLYRGSVALISMRESSFGICCRR